MGLERFLRQKDLNFDAMLDVQTKAFASSCRKRVGRLAVGTVVHSTVGRRAQWDESKVRMLRAVVSIGV